MGNAVLGADQLLAATMHCKGVSVTRADLLKCAGVDSFGLTVCPSLYYSSLLYHTVCWMVLCICYAADSLLHCTPPPSLSTGWCCVICYTADSLLHCIPYPHPHRLLVGAIHLRHYRRWCEEGYCCTAIRSVIGWRFQTQASS
jgi:hypothetical protein